MVIVTRTRSGRHIKKPALFQATESVLEDDYTNEEYDSDDIGSDLDTDEEIYSDEDSDDDEDEGSLQDFIVDDDEESEEEDA